MRTASNRTNKLNEMIAEGRYFMLEDIRKRVKQSYDAEHVEDGYYNNVPLFKVRVDIDTLLSLIDKYKEGYKVIQHLSEGGPEPRVLEINRVVKEILEKE